MKGAIVTYHDTHLTLERFKEVHADAQKLYSKEGREGISFEFEQVDPKFLGQNRFKVTERHDFLTSHSDLFDEEWVRNEVAHHADWEIEFKGRTFNQNDLEEWQEENGWKKLER